jgi:hypothetical protein
MRLLALVVALLLPAVFGVPAFAAECREVQFPDTVKAGEADLVLNGLGLRKATFLGVKVYVAGLYLPQKANDAAQILGADRAWRLVLRFLRDVDGSDIRDAFTDGFDKSTGGRADALRPRLEALNAFVPDLKEGDRMAFTHLAGAGVAVEVNEAPKGAIDGADFAAAMLGIWLGPEPPNDDLKSGLLGGECE